jgi:replication factor C small subunit
MDVQDHYIWAEKYRPNLLSTYIGNKHLKLKISQYIQTSDIPHLLFYGKAGTGKTTLAKIIVKHIECDYLYINASDERNIDTVRDKVKTFASSVGFKPLKVIILDESDYLTPVSQAALRNLMETFSKYTRFILTCNYVERIIDPIQSRCQTYKIIPPSKKEVAIHLRSILETEDIEFNLDDIAVIINASYPDIRQIINSAQRQIIDNELKLDTSSIIQNNYKLKLLELLSSNNSFVQIRQLIADNSVGDYTELYRLLYDEVDNIAPNSVPEVILQIAESQYQDQFSVDKEINFMALIINLLKIIGR